MNDRREGARHQSLFRDVNERIEDVGEQWGTDELTVLCACANHECAELGILTEEQYLAVRRIPTDFFVRPGHVVPEIERVVQEREGQSGSVTRGPGNRCGR